MGKELLSMREAYGKTLVELGEKYKNLVVLDADLSKSTMTKYFAEKFPERFINCGIQEANMMSVASGLASSGMIVFVSTFAIFASGRAWDQIRMSIAYSNANVKIVATHGGFTVGEDGYSHHAINDIALMCSFPNMRVIIPCDAYETKSIIEYVVDKEGPFYIRLPRQATMCVYDSIPKFEIPKADVLVDGDDLTIFACGIMVYESLKASEILKKDGINVSVVNVSTIKPLDEKKIIEQAKKSKISLTVEEHSTFGGLGDAISKILSIQPIKVVRMGINDIFTESASSEVLMEKYSLTANNIALKCKELLM